MNAYRFGTTNNIYGRSSKIWILDIFMTKVQSKFSSNFWHQSLFKQHIEATFFKGNSAMRFMQIGSFIFHIITVPTFTEHFL